MAILEDCCMVFPNMQMTESWPMGLLFFFFFCFFCLFFLFFFCCFFVVVVVVVVVVLFILSPFVLNSIF